MSNFKTSRRIGLIKWYVPKKGFGFIVDWDEENQEFRDVFFHISQYKPDIIPQTRQLTEYYLETTSKGLRATDCVVIRDLELAANPLIQPFNDYIASSFVPVQEHSLE